MFNDKINSSIAEAVKKCMGEELKGDQHKIDANKNGKVDAHDFKLLRGKKKVQEESEQIDEKKYEPAEYDAGAAAARKKREENEERRREARENGEDKPPVRKIAGKAYGGAAQKDDDEVNESVKIEKTITFKSLIESYKEGGIKSLFKKIEEEVDNETFTKEFKDQKDKFDGKKKGADVAAPASQGVVDVKEETHTEIQVVDMTDGSQKPEITTIDLEEKTLTAGETAEKERIVKGMKKNLSGFKQRYGERAKSVMYATATKSAMKEEKVDHWENGYNHVREPIADEPYLDNARIRFNELKKGNPHKKGTPEHGEWHSGAHAAYEEHKDILKGR